MENEDKKLAKLKPLAWHTELRRVDDLIPYSKNPNEMDKQQFRSLVKSIKRTNYAEPMVVDDKNNLIAGHHRQRALQALGRGQEEVEVRVPNRPLTKEEFETYLLASNAVHGGWNYDLLQKFDNELLMQIGFSEDDMSQIWDLQLETEDDSWEEEKELAKIKTPKTKMGQIIQLGPNKLIAGDATDPAVIKKLMGNEQAAMLYLDPVYNLKGGVDYAHGVGGNRNYGGHVNDHRTDAEYREFLKKIIGNGLAVAKPDVHTFCYCDQTYIGLVQSIYQELGIENKRVCLWIKNVANPTPGLAFSKTYEPCVYGLKGKPYLAKGITNLNEIQNKELSGGNRLIEEILDQLDIWLVKRLAASEYQHATSKPPQLHEKAIRRCTRPGDIILDTTAGSGSTLIAAHQLKRRAYLCELELVFCDLIINRFERDFHVKAKYLN